MLHMDSWDPTKACECFQGGTLGGGGLQACKFARLENLERCNHACQRPHVYVADNISRRNIYMDNELSIDSLQKVYRS